MPASVPLVEIADGGDAAGVRGPDGEGRAGDAVDDLEVRAELVVEVVVVALAEEVEVEFAQRRQEGIRIAALL